ncbi:MAG TPA: hypothetical protein VFG42_23650 [Baekduia sp.]|uniref:hypothetical protein n=1 Tax=Baekduia sp. TaxID=2600305 RepID=UPI002D7866D3|nr:hypothetical protein [Baekduia sp.]HET6509809.1 hypothetical protein [Baekduia sp.]
MRLLSRAVAALAAAGALSATAVAPAGAASPVVALGGSPLTVWVGDQGQLQAKRDTDTSNIFFSPSNQVGDAGFFLAFPDVPAAAPAPAQNAALKGRVFGFDGTAGPFIEDEYEPAGQAATTGSGTPTDPFSQITTYAVQSGTPAKQYALITQTTTYVTGAQVFDVRWDVKNTTSPAVPLRFKAISAADFYFEGSDVGTGIYTQGPPRFIGGTNADTGRSGGFVEIGPPSPSLPWSHYQALAFKLSFGTDGNDIWSRVEGAGDAATPSFDDTVVGEPVDNAGAVEWDQYLDPAKTLAGGATASFELLVRTALPAALQFDQTNAGAPQGVPITFTVTAKDTAENPFTGKRLVSAITGANPGSQSAVIGADGKATITDPGVNAGADTIVSFVDLNGNGTREPNEPQGSALATFVDKTPPSCKVAVSGDRPVGSGGQGKPLTITVNCDSVATVTTASTLTIQPAASKATKKTSKAKKSAAAATTKKKPKKKAKAKKPKKVVVKLAPRTASVAPGQALPIAVTVPSSLNKKYPGATATAKVTVTATDTAGNAATTTVTKKVTLAKPKAKAKHKKKRK